MIILRTTTILLVRGCPPGPAIDLRTPAIPMPGGSTMENSRTGTPALGASVLTRALCLLILTLMAAAAAYGASIALRYFDKISV